MQYKIFTKMCLRLIALYFFITYVFYGISAVTYLLEMGRDPNEQVDFGSLSAMMPMLIMIAVSILLWIFAGKLANCFVGKKEDTGIAQKIEYDKLQYIGFSIAGVLVVANAIPDLFACIYQLSEMSKMQMDYGDKLYSTYIEKTISASIQSALGLWLLFGSNGILKAIKKLRTVGNNGKTES